MERDHRLVPVETEGSERMTIGEFERAPETVWRSELVRGRVVREPPAGGEHGSLAGRLHGRLARHVDDHGLGLVLAAETGFEIAPDPDGTVRAPDVAFISKERIPDDGIPRGFWPGPPDLAVEVVSPSNSADQLQGKIFDYLDAGTRMVWVVHPRTRTVTVYRSTEEIRILGEGDVLDGADVVTGFRLPVAELFAL